MADLGFSKGDDFENPTRTEGIWAYGRILYVCEIGRARADTGM